jgi:lysophospholipase L1-like esterase
MGDSLTVGWNPADTLVTKGGYRPALNSMMAGRVEWVGRQNHGPAGVNKHEGYGGNFIRQLMNEKLYGAMMQPADIVLLMIGTNDAWQPWHYDAQSTRQNMTGNLTTFLNTLWNYQPNVKVILSTIPYIHNEPSQQAVLAYNASLPGVVTNFQSLGKQIHLVDSYARMDPLETLNNSDGVHPNAIGYQHIAEAFFSDPWLRGTGPLPPLNAIPEPSSAAMLLLPLFLARRSRV